MKQVISLYGYTGEALRPWADAGYECFAYDIQHDGERTEGNVTYVHADLYDNNTLLKIVAQHNNRVVFMSAFPPCTDLSSAGSRWWKDKGVKNPRFQHEATEHVVNCSLSGRTFGCPFYIENPVGALTRLWRSPDFRFDPYEYGGYLPEDDAMAGHHSTKGCIPQAHLLMDRGQFSYAGHHSGHTFKRGT